jgi:DNA polymerase-3 subunit delta'
VLPDRAAVDPATGWNVWGQANAVRELQQAVATSPSHAYLLIGQARSGRRAAALQFAASLCCQQPPQPGRSCGECSVCRRISRGTFPDVTVVDLATQAARDRDKTKNQSLNIATVREVGSAIAYRPSEARWRIIIVDDAETMQEPAQEAFLKTLEEPPQFAIIVLLATDADRLLDTIRSRCTEVRFGRSADSAVAAALTATGVDTTTVERIVPFAEGSIGWAFEAAREPNMVAARQERRGEAVRMVGATPYDRLVTAIHLADGWSSDRTAVGMSLDSLLAVWRGVLHERLGLAVGPTGSDSQLPIAQITVEQCRRSLEANVRPRLALETMVADGPTVTLPTNP